MDLKRSYETSPDAFRISFEECFLLELCVAALSRRVESGSSLRSDHKRKRRASRDKRNRRNHKRLTVRYHRSISFSLRARPYLGRVLSHGLRLEQRRFSRVMVVHIFKLFRPVFVLVTTGRTTAGWHYHIPGSVGGIKEASGRRKECCDLLTTGRTKCCTPVAQI